MQQIGFCVKCKKKHMMKNITKKKMLGKLQVKGLCAVCGTKMSTFAKA